MQYKVPQHVDIEDKVIGALTIRQFVIVLIGVGVIGLLKVVMVAPLDILFWPIAFVLGAGIGAIAFAKYGDQNMEVFLFSAIKTFINPRKRVWQKEPYKPEEHKDEKPVQKAEEPKDSRINIADAEGSLERLAEVVDSGGYSIFDNAAGKTNLEKASDLVDATTPDILSKAESGSTTVDTMLEEASRVAPEREELVSEAATVLPDKNQAETPTIKLRKDQFYKEIK